MKPHKERKIVCSIEAQMSMATSICKYPNAQKQGYEMSLKDDEKRAKGFLEF